MVKLLASWKQRNRSALTVQLEPRSKSKGSYLSPGYGEHGEITLHRLESADLMAQARIHIQQAKDLWWLVPYPFWAVPKAGPGFRKFARPRCVQRVSDVWRHVQDVKCRGA